MPRFSGRSTITNFEDMYKSFFKKRGVNAIVHYDTPSNPPLTELEEEQIGSITHIWSLGDRYYKLAYKHYGDPALWWVIAWYNQAPTESHLTIGEDVEVPFPIDKVLMYYYQG